MTLLPTMPDYAFGKEKRPATWGTLETCPTSPANSAGLEDLGRGGRTAGGAVQRENLAEEIRVQTLGVARCAAMHLNEACIDQPGSACTPFRMRAESSPC